MKRKIFLCMFSFFWMVLSVHLQAHAQSDPASTANVRIMPLGDSITAGYRSTTGNGYRGPLAAVLKGQVGALDLVGSQIGGTMADPDHEGHYAYEIAQLAALTTAQLNAYKPNIVLLDAGINDLGNGDDVTNAPNRLGSLIDQILAAEPDASVLVAQLIVNSNATVESEVVAFNQQLATVVQEKAAAGRHVFLVDMSALTTANLNDGLHPNDAGYQRMANAWDVAIQQVIALHWVSDPLAGSTTRPTGFITSGIAGMCLDNLNGSSNPTNPADLQTCNGAAAQQWNINNAAITTNGLCLDAKGGGTGNGTQVILYGCTGAPNQKWTVQNNTIVNTASGRCLDDPGFSRTNGTPLQIWDCNGGINQQWQAPFEGSIQSGLPGLCLDAFSGSASPGNKVDAYGCNQTAAQQWTFANGTLTFDGQCLSISGESGAGGTPIVLSGCTGSSNQTWALTNGRFVNSSSESCLSVPGASTLPGTQLTSTACTSGANQQWTAPEQGIVTTTVTADTAAAAYAAWNAAFLVQQNGNTYYADEEVSQGSEEAKLYTDGLNVAIAEDVYQHNHRQDQRNLIVSLLDTFLSDFGNGENWGYDGYDDDLGWMTNAVLRGYQITGNPAYLTAAENNWNTAYNRGWNAALGGGMEEDITKKDGVSDREALSDDPFVFTGVTLYQITGDASYLTKAQGIYAWVRENLFNPTYVTSALGASGQVNQGLRDSDNSLIASDNTYNGGSFITAAAALYRVTGVQQYYDDAVLAIAHRIKAEPILHSTNECCGNQWAYWFTYGLGQFATEANLWPQYLTYMQTNADAAWKNRNAANLTWNDWTTPTSNAVALKNPDAVEMESAVAIWQHLPPTPVALAGNYEIQSVVNGLALEIPGASTDNGASVVQSPFSGAANALWTFVPTSGGYYQIKNVNSGQIMNVAAVSVTNGAPVVQWPAGRIVPGNDQWMPVVNPDGSYTFYNLNSLQALDVPGASSTSGLQLDQWFDNNTPAQKFKLIAQP